MYLLLYSNSQSVYAYGPHDGVCTVIYGSKTLEDFPVSNLRFEGDGEEYFYGRKQYSYDEYISYVKSLTKDQLESTRVSTPDVANFIDAQRFLFILIGVDTIFGIVLFVLYKQEMNGWFDIALLVCCLYSVFFEMITFFAFGR